MKIKRFYESNDNEIDNISPERINDILNDLNETLSIINTKNKIIESYLEELENYKSNSKKGNDQIDDSIFSFQIINKNLSDTSFKIESIINNFIDYNDNGRKYLYTEK